MTEKYPLEIVLTIKIKKFEDAIKLFEAKTKKFLEEQEKLFKEEEEKNKILNHKLKKLEKLREDMDKGEGAAKIKPQKLYLKTVDDKLKEQEKRVEKQQKEVEKAEKELEEAKKNLLEKKKGVEKLKIHKGEWKKEMKKLEDKIEAIQQDEIGTIRFIRKKYGKH